MVRMPKFVIPVCVLVISLVISFVPVAQAAKPVRIGFGMALTGGLALAGRAAVLAMKIWRDDVNKRGGLLGRKVELVYYDDKTKPAEVPAIYAKLIDVDKVDFVVSGYGTNLIVPAIPTVADRKMVFMTLFGLAANAKLKYRYYFQIMPAGPKPMTDWSNGYFEIAAKQRPKPKTIAFLAADAEFARNAVAGARKNAKKYGFKIVYDKTYPPKTADFTPTLRVIKAVNADLVYIASYPPGSVGVTKAAKEIGLKPKLFGGTMVGLQYAAFLTNLGPMLNGLVNYDFWVPETTLDFPGIEEFLRKYQARAPKEKLDPLGHYLPPFAYSYVQILGQAIEATKSFDQKTVGEYIRTHEFTTVVGKVKFAPNGEWATTRMLMVQYQNIVGNDVKQFFGPGKRVVLYPKSVRSGNIIYPFPGFK